MAKRFVVERVTETGGRVCPPPIVGIGGTADLCRKLAKIAATRRLGSGCDDQEGAAQERELSAAVNGLGIGPLLVAMDAHGAGLYDDMHKASTERMEAYGANEGRSFLECTNCGSDICPIQPRIGRWCSGTI